MPPPGGATPMMQHPGMGLAPAGGRPATSRRSTRRRARDAIAGADRAVALAAAGSARRRADARAVVHGSLGAARSDAEIRVLRRRVEQLQTELGVYRAQKFNPDTARRMEELENDLSMMEIERDNLKSRARQGRARAATLEAGSAR